ncbi:MAG: aminotransferase class IV [Planctomycetaceae bacterium]|nr:aminotransferase class IV [Planctomycetaceae bacterium]
MAQLPWANWNGTAMPLADVRVSVLDRGFLFGDGIYEVLRVYGGRPFLLSEHMARLRRSLNEIQIQSDVDRLEARMHATLRDSGIDGGMVYMQITRGEAPRTHRFPNPPATPNELIYVDAIAVDPYAAWRENGAKLLTVPDVRWRRCDIKSVNLLANCLAAQAAAEAGCQEALLVTADGTITEGSHTSIFAVQGGRILATPLGPQILPGITRGLVVKLAARAGIEIEERSAKLAELDSLDEMFLTGTTSEVLPVTQVDGRPIGNGRPGPVTAKLVATYGEYVRDWLAGRGE